MTKEIENEINLTKREKTLLRKNWNSSFLTELDIILEKCFLRYKSKKEHFITKDKIELELIKLLQSQKKFLAKDDFRKLLSCQAVFDKKESAVAKLLKINYTEKTIEALSIFEKNIIRDFDDVIFFDVYSIEFAAMFEKQKLVIDLFDYRQTFHFLTYKEKQKTKKSANYLVFDKKDLNKPLTQTDIIVANQTIVENISVA